MREKIAHILILLLATTAVLSCSTGITLENPSGSAGIEITGAVTDAITGEPLDEIKITLTTIDRSDNESDNFIKTVYTDNKGTFKIISEADKGINSCFLLAEDPDGVYLSDSQTINITWTQSNMHHGVFYVNDIFFYLEKAEK